MPYTIECTEKKKIMAVHLTTMLCKLKEARMTTEEFVKCCHELKCWGGGGFSVNLIFLNPYLALFQQHDMIIACKELWLNVRFTIFFSYEVKINLFLTWQSDFSLAFNVTIISIVM